MHHIISEKFNLKIQFSSVLAKILSTLDKSSLIAEEGKNDFSQEAKVAANNNTKGIANNGMLSFPLRAYTH